MTKVRTIIAGVDTPNDHGPTSVLAAMGVQPLADEERHDLAARVLFLPSFHPEVCLTIERAGDKARVSLVTLQTNLWYWRSYQMQLANGNWPEGRRAPRRPERWKEIQPVPADRLVRFTEEITALRVHEEPPSESVGLDGMTVHGWYRQVAGQLQDFQFWFRQPERPRSRLVRQVYALAVELLQDECSQRVLESLHGYLHLGLPAKHQAGRPYVVRIFGRLSASDRSALEASLAQVPPEVPLLLDLSNFDGMGTLLHPVLREFLRRAGPVVCWATGEQARTHLESIGVSTSAILATREEALDSLRGV